MTTSPCPSARNVIMGKGSLVALLPRLQVARLDRIPMVPLRGDTEGRLFRTWRHAAMRYKEVRYAPLDKR